MIGLLRVSSTVTCKVVVDVPSSGNDVGLAVRLLVVPVAGPATNVTVVVLVTPAKLAVTVTGCATELLRVTEHRPEVVVLHVVVLNVAPVPLLLKVTDWPLTGLPCASSTVICRLVVLELSAVSDVGLALRELVPLLAGPATKEMVVSSVTVPIVAVMFSFCATVDAKVVVQMPEAFVLPLVPLVALQVFALPLAETDTA